MVMWRFRSCPRCRGDIFIQKDHDGWHKRCLQCGYLSDMSSTIEADQHGKEKKKKEPVR